MKSRKSRIHMAQKETLTFNEARRTCVKAGGDLSSMTSAEIENAAIASIEDQEIK